MTKYIYTLILVLMTLCSCQKPTKFKIKGQLTDDSNTNLYVKYYGNGGVNTGVTAARDGKFEAEFSSADPTVVELLDNDYRVLGRLYIQNGDEVEMTIDRANPYLNQVTGTDINVEWSTALNKYADILIKGDSNATNDVITQYITDNPDSMVGTLMFATMYDASADPVKADSVLNLINPDMRNTSVLANYTLLIQPFIDPGSYSKVKPIKYRTPQEDSTLIFSPSDRPASLLVFSNEISKRSDSIVPKLKKIYAANKASKLQILDIGIIADVSVWRNISRRDSAKWIQAWVPGGIMGDGLSELAIPSIPYYIVTDSAGMQHYRGTSAERAGNAIKAIIDK